VLLKPSVVTCPLVVIAPHEHTASTKVDWPRIPRQLDPPSSPLDGSPPPLQFGPACPPPSKGMLSV
jgi:hypothetical protein